MTDTYRLMNQVRLNKFANYALEDLVDEYRKTDNQSILAEVFCRSFKSMCQVIYEGRYKVIDNQDKVDCAMESVSMALAHYDKTKNASLITFVIKNLRCRLATQLIYLNQAKRKATVYSLDAMKEKMGGNEVEENFDIIHNTPFDEVENTFDLYNSGLTNKEIAICQIIMDNPNISNVELAKVLNCHRHTIARDKTTLRNKLQFILA